jgi:uncharacterized protein (DUF927 family)
VLADNEILEKAGRAKNGYLFRRLWSGDWKKSYSSQSEADQALCALLAFWTDNDPGRIDRLFRQSGLYREKWEREDYRQRTIAAAIAATPTTYQPPRRQERHSQSSNSQHTNAADNPPADAPAVGASSFRLTADGVYYQAPGSEKRPMRICGRLEIVAMTRDAEGAGWGWLLRWCDREGRVHEWPMPASLLAGDLVEVRSRLLDGGLRISSGRGVGALLSEYIQTAAVEARALCVSRVGWYGDSFVLPTETIGPNGAEQVIFQTQHEGENLFNVSGPLAEWRESVAARCAGNSRLVLSVSCGVAGPVLALLAMESGGIHLVGATSTGKSTALAVCGSVLGGGGRNGFVQTWNATANGLEAMASLHNDTCLLLDEMAQILPEEAAEVAYLLANGTGKARMTRQVASRKKLVWTLLFLSAGEITLEDHVRTIGKQVRGGVEVRLLNIEADAGAGLGLFENLHGAESADAFARELKEAAKNFYGSPLRSFLQRLVNNRAAAENTLRTVRREFLECHLPPGAAGEVSRAAARLGLIAGAGELATEWGITGWRKGEAFSAAGRCFSDWLAARGTVGASDIERAIADVRRFIEKHGNARFQEVRPLVNEERAEGWVVRDRAGFRRITEDGEAEYLVLPEVFRAELCKGHNARQVAQALDGRGYLECQPPSLMRKVRLPEIGAAWVYSIKAAILQA